MSDTAEEISMVASEFRARLRKQSTTGLRPRPIFLGTFSDGSRYMIELQGGRRYFYLVTDLPPGATATQPISGTVTGQLQVFDPVLPGWENWFATDIGSGTAIPSVLLAANSTVGLGPPGLGNTVAMQTTNPGGAEIGLVVRVINSRGLADSISVGGSVTAPGAGAVIATMTPGVAGIYEVFATASIALGAPVAGDEANMQLRITAAVHQLLPYNGSFGGPFGPYRLTLTAVNTLNIIAVAAGTVGVVYTAGITCKRVA